MESLWAITNTVLPFIRLSIPFSIRASVLVSMEDVASAYAAAYPIALIAVVLVSQFIIVLFPDPISLIGM